MSFLYPHKFVDAIAGDSLSSAEINNQLSDTANLASVNGLLKYDDRAADKFWNAAGLGEVATASYGSKLISTAFQKLKALPQLTKPGILMRYVESYSSDYFKSANQAENMSVPNFSGNSFAESENGEWILFGGANSVILINLLTREEFTVGLQATGHNACSACGEFLIFGHTTTSNIYRYIHIQDVIDHVLDGNDGTISVIGIATGTSYFIDAVKWEAESGKKYIVCFYKGSSLYTRVYAYIHEIVEQSLVYIGSFNKTDYPSGGFPSKIIATKKGVLGLNANGSVVTLINLEGLFTATHSAATLQPQTGTYDPETDSLYISYYVDSTSSNISKYDLSSFTTNDTSFMEVWTAPLSIRASTAAAIYITSAGIFVNSYHTIDKSMLISEDGTTTENLDFNFTLSTSPITCLTKYGFPVTRHRTSTSYVYISTGGLHV